MPLIGTAGSAFAFSSGTMSMAECELSLPEDCGDADSEMGSGRGSGVKLR